MNNQVNYKRVRDIYEMLFEMAAGNFSLRLIKSKKEDELDQVAAILNELAEQIDQLFQTLGNDAPKYIIKKFLQPLIILKDRSIIQSFNQLLAEQLDYKEDFLIQMDFYDIITKESKKVYDKLQNRRNGKRNTANKIKLTFVGNLNQKIHFFCTVEKLFPSNIVVISTVSNLLEQTRQSNFVIDKNKDELKIAAIYEYIMTNLRMPLPTTKEFAERLNINEFKIKEDFRKKYQTSIYKLYTDERLKLAYTLIEQTNMSFVSIAYESGYPNYTTFYKAFLKKYNCNPTKITRKEPMK
ncbi:helix-turn-helix domain-containing protein [Flavobacterium tegetincola]|uniref:helix-turn-helix domain-containing protein n=1 Tax=Flavobacterium tegetincola TaxID=150172 RepID=UPI00040089B1|nr:helix-turn-helix domain-containing protein [Flavobacterium tegetincola]